MHSSWGVPCCELAPDTNLTQLRPRLEALAREHADCCGCLASDDVQWALEVLTRPLAADDVIYVARARVLEAARVLGVGVLEKTERGRRLYFRGFVQVELARELPARSAGTRVLDRPNPLAYEAIALTPELFVLGEEAPAAPALDNLPLEQQEEAPWLFLYDGRAPPQPMNQWNVEHESRRRLAWLLEFRHLETRNWRLATSSRQDYERDRDTTHVLSVAFCFDARQRAWYVNIETRALELLLRWRYRSEAGRMALVQLNGYDEAQARANAHRLAEWIVSEMRRRLEDAMARACAALTPHLEHFDALAPIEHVLAACVNARG